MVLILFLWLYLRWDPRQQISSSTLWIGVGWLIHACACIAFALTATRFANNSYFVYGTINLSMQLFFGSWFLVCLLFQAKSTLIKTEDI